MLGAAHDWRLFWRAEAALSIIFAVIAAAAVAPGWSRDAEASAEAERAGLGEALSSPAFWVLADPEGNEACVCTWLGRD